MSFLDLVQRRQSVRTYLDKPIPRDLIDPCLEAARFAPSATNAQPWTFVVVDEPELRARVAGATFNAAASFNRFVLAAQAIVVVVAERPTMTSRIGSMVKGRDFRPMDIGMAACNFINAAADAGLGTCVLG